MKEGFNWQMTLITFLPHTPFKKKNVLTFLIGTVISMGKRKKQISLLTYRKSNSSFSQWNDLIRSGNAVSTADAGQNHVSYTGQSVSLGTLSNSHYHHYFKVLLYIYCKYNTVITEYLFWSILARTGRSNCNEQLSTSSR